MTIKAIETVYNGYKFRSRLEARWAVFFDALEIEYQYEPEGFDLDGVWYLPDFWLPEQLYWLEIKPDHPTHDEMEKASRLAQGLKVNVFIICGEPWARSEYVGEEYFIRERKYGAIGFFGHPDLMAMHDGAIGWMHGKERPDVKPWGGEYANWTGDLLPDSGDNALVFSMQYNGIRFEYVAAGADCCEGPLPVAYLAARQARFEHGECG